MALNSYVISFGDDIDQKKMEKIKEKEKEKELMEEALLKKCQQAKTAMDLKEELCKMIGDEIVYCETEETNDILMYYPLLDSRDEYIILSQGEKEYVLFYYWMSSYGEKLKDIVSITKEYTYPNQTTLQLNVETKTSKIKSRGDFPHFSYARCLIELDRKITCLVVNGVPYHQYDGGIGITCYSFIFMFQI